MANKLVSSKVGLVVAGFTLKSYLMHGSPPEVIKKDVNE